MNALRVPLLVTSVAVLLVSSCGGDSKPSGGGLKQCAPANSTCTTAETNAYGNCVVAACDATYKECYGPGYKTGTYSGSCGTWFKCAAACPCNDSACASACGLPDAACLNCSSTLVTCTGTCTLPACYPTTGGTGGASGGGTGGASGGGTGGASGGGTGCTNLLACCNAAVDATLKTACMTYYTSVMSMGDAVCASTLTSLKQAGACP